MAKPRGRHNLMMASHFILNCGDFSSWGHINRCSGGNSVEDATGVQTVQHLENKTAVYFVSGQSKQMLNSSVTSDFHCKLSRAVIYWPQSGSWGDLRYGAHCKNQSSQLQQPDLYPYKEFKNSKASRNEGRFPRLMSVCRGAARDPVTSHMCNSGFKSPSRFSKGSRCNNCCTGYLLITYCNVVDIQATISASRRTHIVWLSSSLIIFWICCCHSPSTFV